MAIICPTRKFIFVKTVKTAGTSIEIDLAHHLGPEAIVTPIIPPVPGHVPRNHSRNGRDDWFFNHMPARLLRHRLGTETFDGMFRFCVEREPVSKCISHFHMLKNSPQHATEDQAELTWDAYVEARRFPVDLSRYTTVENGRPVLLVDRVLRYDRLPGALDDLMAELGLSGFHLQSRAKSEYSHRVRVTPDEVTDRQRRIIHDAFAETSEVTGIDWSRP